MASRRRSLEEKNLKILRELAAYPANKQCFDCHQRGPTYINMTIGSFVCTSCSGLLRGLTPPHRVKSITMTMFTPEEIEFLRSRGNEYCRHVWLGTYDSRTSNTESEGKDEHRKKDLMVQKYEKKRWHVDPEIAVKKMQQDQLLQQKQAMHIKQYNRLPEVQPLAQLFGKMPAHTGSANNQMSEKWPHPVSSASAPQVSQGGLQSSMSFPTQGMHSFDLFPEFGKVSLMSPTAEVASLTTANGNFANFDSAFNSTPTPVHRKASSALSSNKTQKTSAPPTGWTSFEDELDPLSPTASASSSHSISSASAVSRVQTCSSIMPRPLSLPTFAPTNPFKTFPVTNSVYTATQWMSFPASTATSSVMSTSASLDAYPAFAQFPKKVSAPPPPVPAPVSANMEKPMQDRYAALADLDTCFNQPSVTSPSWSIKAVSTTTNTATTASVFGFSSSDAPVGNLFSTASSNPFAAPTSAPWPPQTSKPFATVNPFQSSAEPCLPYQPPQVNSVFAPLPVVGNSPSDDAANTPYNATNSTPFNAGDMPSPSNGFGSTHFPTIQNGDFSAGFNAWGMSPSTSMPASFSASHTSQGAFNAVDKRANEFSQYSNWDQNPVNPFMAGNFAQNPPSLPKSNSNNPFL